jgi:hypothetical protein
MDDGAGWRPQAAIGVIARAALQDCALALQSVSEFSSVAKRKNLMPVDKAAAEAGCAAILTEDMANGAVLHGVRIINPFAAGGPSAEAERLPGGAG